MAFRNLAHAEKVYKTDAYRRMVREYLDKGARVPLSVFQKDYGNAFFGRLGQSVRPSSSKTSQEAFLRLMYYIGKSDPGITWQQWLDANDYNER